MTFKVGALPVTIGLWGRKGRLRLWKQAASMWSKPGAPCVTDLPRGLVDQKSTR